MNEYRALFKNMDGKLIPRLSCFVTNELTEHSHTSMTIQNPAHLIGRGTVACKEDNGRQHSSMDDSDADSATPSGSNTTTTAPRKKLKRLQKWEEE